MKKIYEKINKYKEKGFKEVYTNHHGERIRVIHLIKNHIRLCFHIDTFTLNSYVNISYEETSSKNVSCINSVRFDIDNIDSVMECFKYFRDHIIKKHLDFTFNLDHSKRR